MAFVKKDLKDAISAVFSSMGSSGDNSVFYNGITNAVVAFVLTGDVSTQDEGTVSAGAFSGSGSGKLTVTATKCAKTIKDACDLMKDSAHGNDFLAEEIGKGIQQMADDGTVATTVTGECVTPQGSTISPYGGSAKGSISCDSSSLVASLKDVFRQMWNNKSVEGYDGNAEFASVLADAVYAFWTNGEVSTNGEGNIEGSTGTGTIS